jgi:hypothetical protein
MNQNLDPNDTKELLQREVESTFLSRISLIFVAFSIVYCVHSIMNIGFFLTDNSVPLVVCPRNFVVDAPVLMKPIRDEGAIVQDRWIRGFIRRYITSQMPRTAKDVEPFFKYALNHSDGLIKEKYQAFVKDKEEIQILIGSGSFYRFYPKHIDQGQPSIRIRGTDTVGQWVVEVDGYLIKKMSNIQERYTPTLRYTVEAGKPTIQNPEGLYVIDGTFEQITDYVSNTKEKL